MSSQTVMFDSTASPGTPFEGQNDPASHDAVKRFEEERVSQMRSQRLWLAVGFLVIGGLFAWSFTISEFFTGDRGDGLLQRLSYFLEQMNPGFKGEVFFEPAQTDGSFLSWYYGWKKWLYAIWVTIQIAIVSSVFGALISVPVALMVSRNLMPVKWVRFSIRRVLEAIRTLPDIIVAMILVAAFGIGPLAGVITITFSTLGRLGKLFSEVNENADMRQMEGVKAAGGGWWSQLRYGLLPQVAPNYASYAMLKFEGNIGTAAALGIIGAGGIGIDLSFATTMTMFADYLAILLMLTFVIFLVDMTSEWIRHRLIGMPEGKTI